jgi:hypothetical protein
MTRPEQIEGLDCAGFRKLVAEYQECAKREPDRSGYRTKLDWIVARARHYAEQTGLDAAAILDAWEARRTYWYMNYYQDAGQPLIGEGCRVFATVAELLADIGKGGFRCPACAGVSRSPYECKTADKIPGVECDWKVYGLFGHMGKGISVFVKDKMQVEAIFMPIAWEKQTP